MLPAPRNTTKSPGFGELADHRRDHRRLGDVARVAVAAGADAVDELFRVDAVDRVLAGGIDRRHDDRIGIVEAGGEFVEQIAQARETMRLGDRDDAARRGVARGLEHRLDLDRMVAVVVEDIDAVPRAGAGEAALDAAEGGKALLDVVGGDAEFMRDGDRRGRVRHVVAAGHRQSEVGDQRIDARLAVADRNVELRRRAVHAMVR